MWAAEFCLCEDHNELWLTANRKFFLKKKKKDTVVLKHICKPTVTSGPALVYNSNVGIEHTPFPILLTHNENTT